MDNTADASKPVSTAQAAADTAVQAYAIQRANHTGTQTASTISDFATQAAKYGPVTSVNGLTGDVTVSGGSGSYTLPTATDTVLGGVKVGTGLAISSGVLSATGGGSYTLPTASDTVLGGIKVGANLTITAGVLASSDSRWGLFMPPAPTSVTATGGNAQASVSWTAPTGVITQAPVTDYVVQFQPSGGSWSTFSDGTSTATSATVTGLTNGTSYTFRVAAVNGIGQGAWSSASEAVTPASLVVANIIQTTAGLYAWYDAAADDTLYSAQSGGSVVTTDGGLIYRVADKSGNGRHLYTFDNGSSVPRLALAAKNGKNGILFDNDSRNDTFKSAANRESGSFSTGNPLTMFAVLFVQSGRNDTYIFDDVRYSWFDRELSTATGLSLNGGAVSVSQPGQATWTGSNTSRAGTWMCVRAVLNGTSSSLYVNGSYDAPGGPNSSPGGSTASDYNFTRTCADIRLTGRYTLGELVFFSGAISSGTAASIDSYLMTKWGITSEAVSSKLTVTRRNGSPSTFTGAGTAASPFTRAARVLNSNADGLASASNGTASGVSSGAYAFTATASGTAYVTVTFHDDDSDGWVGTIKKNGADQGGMSLSDGQTATAMSFAVSAGDVVTFYAGNTNTSFSNVSVWVV